MKLLQVSLALWLTVFFASYNFVIMVLFITLFLFKVTSLRYVLLYCFLSVGIVFHINSAIPSEPTVYDGKVIAIKDTYVLVNVNKQTVLVSNVNDVSMYDYISFYGEYKKITGFENSGLFDYVRFRSRHHTYYQLYADSFSITKKGTSIPSVLYQWTQKQNNESFRSLAKRFLFQVQQEEEYEFVSVLISSGMHLSILVLWLERIVSFFFTQRKVKFIALCFPFVYGLCFGYSLSVLRIICTRLLSFTSLTNQQRLACLMIVLLAIDPHYAFSLSFVIPVVLRLALLFRYRLIPPSVYRSLVLFPIILHVNYSYTFFQAVLFSWFRQLFALIHLFCMFGLLLPFLQTPLVNMYEKLIYYMEGKHEVFSFGIVMKVSLLFCVLWIGFLCLIPTSKKKALIGLFSISIIQWLFVFAQPWSEVTFLDVGQGDATFISMPFSQSHILIDTGGHMTMDIADMVLVPYLKKKGISKLDLVILTHDDMDHSGAYDSLSNFITVKRVIANKQTDFDDHGISTILVNNQKVHLLHQDVVYDNDNDNSLIVYIELASRSFLFMGDASKSVERALIKRYENLEVDVLHVGHHGSTTSTSKEFVIHSNPSLAVISSGKGNQYNHPHPDVVRLLETQGVLIMDTKEQGSITLILNELFSFVRTYASRFAIIEAVIS